MELKKTLKHISFSYQDSDSSLRVSKDGVEIPISKVEMFALNRFCIRISQRNFKRHGSKKTKKEKTSDSNPKTN